MKSIQRLFVLLSFLAITACQPSLKEFQPASDSLFKITFSYPDSWFWVEEIPYDEPIGEPPPSELMVYRDGLIDIMDIQVFKPSDPRELMQHWMDSYLRAVGTMLISDTTIQIDGYEARWLTVLYPPLTTNESYLQESIYLLTDDRFYTIGLSIWESEINGQLHKQFKKLVKSIKVLP